MSMRLVLILSLLLQPMMLLVRPGCAMGEPVSAASPCDCCEDMASADTPCGFAEAGYAGCDCEPGSPEDRKAPSPDNKSPQFNAVIAIASAFVNAAPDTGASQHLANHSVSFARPPNRSVQSLLCVWLT